jgi:hypothetical protein
MYYYSDDASTATRKPTRQPTRAPSHLPTQAYAYNVYGLSDCSVTETEFKVVLFDSMCDGWEHNYLTFDKGVTRITFDEKGLCNVTKSVCLADGTYQPYACGGDYPSEISWVWVLSDPARGDSAFDSRTGSAGVSCGARFSGKIKEKVEAVKKNPHREPGRRRLENADLHESRQLFGSIAPTVTPAPTVPNIVPISSPSFEPTPRPTQEPTSKPTHPPTLRPTHSPVFAPTSEPSPAPTFRPSPRPTATPKPSNVPTSEPTAQPTVSSKPSAQPTPPPSQLPTLKPTPPPTQTPTPKPTNPTQMPTPAPTFNKQYDLGLRQYVLFKYYSVMDPIECASVNGSEYCWVQGNAGERGKETQYLGAYLFPVIQHYNKECYNCSSKAAKNLKECNEIDLEILFYFNPNLVSTPHFVHTFNASYVEERRKYNFENTGLKGAIYMNFYGGVKYLNDLFYELPTTHCAKPIKISKGAATKNKNFCGSDYQKGLLTSSKKTTRKAALKNYCAQTPIEPQETYFTCKNSVATNIATGIAQASGQAAIVAALLAAAIVFLATKGCGLPQIELKGKGKKVKAKGMGAVMLVIKDKCMEAQTKKPISLREVFDVLDTDGDGTLTREEVSMGAKSLGLTNMQAMRLFDALDTNRSGFLSLEETTPKPKLTLENLAYVMMEQRIKAQAEVAELRAQVAQLEALSVESSNLKAAQLAAAAGEGASKSASSKPRVKVIFPSDKRSDPLGSTL